MPYLSATHHIDEGVMTCSIPGQAKENISPDSLHTEEPSIMPPSHHSHLKKGMLDPELNKIVHEIVLCSDHFVVYVAEDLSVQWRTDDDHKDAEHCGEILNRVSILESRSHFVPDLASKGRLRCQIAEGLARCFSGYAKDVSVAILDDVALQLNARNKEVSWKWYFTAAYFVTFFCFLSSIALWLGRDFARSLIGSTGFDVVLGTMYGSVGALLSVTARGNRLIMDANAGKPIHQLEGLSRIGAGIIGALLVGLAIKSHLILGGVQFSGSSLATLLVFCIAAGASERLVPSLVENFEKVALSLENKSVELR